MQEKNSRVLTGGSIAIMCPACWRGSMAAGPDGVQDPNPNTNAALKACAPNGFPPFSGSSVLTDRHLIQLLSPRHQHASSGGLGRLAAPRRCARHRDPCRSGPSRCSIPAGPQWRFDRRKLLTKIELTYRLQHVGYSAVAQVRRQGCQPSGILGLKAYECADGVVPALGAAYGRLDDADRRSAGRCAPRGSGPGVRHPSWASRRLIDGAWVPLRSDTSRNGVRRIRRRPADAGRPSPLVIMAQAVRAILFASATAASLRGRRWSSFSSQSVASLLPDCRVATLITAVAPVTSNWRSRSLPARLMPPMRCLPPVECSFGASPSQSAR